MATTGGRTLWEVPLTVLVCIAGSEVLAGAAGRVLRFEVDPSVVALLSGVLSAAAIARRPAAGEWQAERPNGG